MYPLLEATAPVSEQQQLIDSLFTAKSLFTIAGAPLAVNIVCGTAQRVFNFNPKWLALALSILISVAGAIFASENVDSSRYFVAFFNGFIIYVAATGTNSVTSSLNEPPGENTNTFSASKRGFTSRWW